MRVVLGSVVAIGCLVFITPAEVIRFDQDIPGQLPPMWTVAMTHSGSAPQWQVVRDLTAPSPPFVIAQISKDKTAGRFPLAVWDRASIRDGEIRVSFKTVSGTVDQAAGVLWRYRDPNNYYVVRANALENNVVLYKVEKGTRLSLPPKGLPSRAYGVKHEIPKLRWNVLRVKFKGALFIVFLNEERLLEVEDGTFTQPGKTGLWTKADSVTYFDDFSVTEIGPNKEFKHVQNNNLYVSDVFRRGISSGNAVGLR
jgi:hypothetical protein